MGDATDETRVEGTAEAEAAGAEGDDGGEERDGERDGERVELPEVEPQPGLTAPLDEVTEEEDELEPVGVMPGAGPDEEPNPDRAEKQTSPEESGEQG